MVRLHSSVADCKDQGLLVELDFAWVAHSLSNPSVLIGSECVKVSGRSYQSNVLCRAKAGRSVSQSVSRQHPSNHGACCCFLLVKSQDRTGRTRIQFGEIGVRGGSKAKTPRNPPSQKKPTQAKQVDRSEPASGDVTTARLPPSWAPHSTHPPLPA